MEAELAKVGLQNDPRISFFPAIRPPSAGDFSSAGARGCFEGHLQILHEAVEAGQSVLILEDDCSFTERAADYEVPEDCDIFYGGYHAKNVEQPWLGDVQESHMMGFSARGARLVSEYLDNLEYEGIHPPIDASYVWYRRAHPETPTHFAAPPIGVQRSSASDIAPRPWDRFGPTRMLAAGLRKLRAKAQG
ncbi:hypothetical protein GRI38_10545 [Altererythrobacter aurantiacus]|uniref:Glycosyltransferase family 25 (LPS biosynthesis protein) n=1 Tax=Parapontixanthobacter aurantiacus TaxID=1463599 RepID=A0A844ZGG6_9SPHN|nr:hypothetical protein [Parapontixanthobacter aurantiacus]MXO86463.1 hypothetical protein [Parapontixanthobacter aurantiacus]